MDSNIQEITLLKWSDGLVSTSYFQTKQLFLIKLQHAIPWIPIARPINNKYAPTYKSSNISKFFIRNQNEKHGTIQNDKQWYNK